MWYRTAQYHTAPYHTQYRITPHHTAPPHPAPSRPIPSHPPRPNRPEPPPSPTPLTGPHHARKVELWGHGGCFLCSLSCHAVCLARGRDVHCVVPLARTDGSDWSRVCGFGLCALNILCRVTGLRPRHDCVWMWVGMGKAAAGGVVWPHTLCLGQVWSNRPLICVLKCFGCAVHGLQNRDRAAFRNFGRFSGPRES